MQNVPENSAKTSLPCLHFKTDHECEKWKSVGRKCALLPAMRDTNINLLHLKGRFMLLISYFQVAPSFCFKARISDKPLMSKLMIFFTPLQKTHYFTRNVWYLASFQTWNFLTWNGLLKCQWYWTTLINTAALKSLIKRCFNFISSNTQFHFLLRTLKNDKITIYMF